MFKEKHLYAWLAVASLLFLISSFFLWRFYDFRMPASWFRMVHSQPDNSIYWTLEGFRYNLIKNRWKRAAQKVDLVGRWRCDAGRDGYFTCEFTDDGVFHITPDDANGTWAVWAKDLNGLPWERLRNGFSIPARRSGNPNSDSGTTFGPAFKLIEGNDRFTYGYISSEGATLNVTMDSHFLAIVYERSTWTRID